MNLVILVLLVKRFRLDAFVGFLHFVRAYVAGPAKRYCNFWEKLAVATRMNFEEIMHSVPPAADPNLNGRQAPDSTTHALQLLLSTK